MSENTNETVSDADIFFPDETLEISGDEIEVREFRYLEGLRAIALARRLFEGLSEILEAGDIDALNLDDLIVEHYEAWITLITISTGQSREWIEGLRDRDGQALSMTFWRVNSGFFMRRLVLGGVLARAMRQMENPSPSAKSSTLSSQVAMAATSAASPDA